MQDVVGDVEDVVVDVGMVNEVDVVVVLTLVAEQLLLETQTLPRAKLICRLMATLMMVHSSYMIVT